MPLRTPQIPHGLVKAWTPSSAVQVQRPTVFAVARHEWPRHKATECEFLILWSTGCGKETGGNYKETLEVNCEVEKAIQIAFFLRVQVNCKSGTSAPRGIAWPEQTNPAISDGSTLRYHRFCCCLFAAPLLNINSFISLCYYQYRATASTHVVITSTYATEQLNLSVCCCPLHPPPLPIPQPLAEHTSILFSLLRNLTNTYGSHSYQKIL